MDAANYNASEIRDLDPVTFEVLRSHFDFCCERMSKVLQKTAFSPILSDILDYSNAVYDADIRLVSQSPGCPIHMAAMHFAAQESVNKYGKEALRPGDVVVLNDPFQGGTHIPDTTFTMPIFSDDRLLGFAVSRGHWQDLGGGAAGGQSFGTHIAGEGLRIPPLKLFNEYEMNQDLLALIKNNTRCPEYIEGDIQAHMGALKVAEQEFNRAVDRYGLETVEIAMRELIAYTNRISRSRIEAIPDGEYAVTDFVDTDRLQRGADQARREDRRRRREDDRRLHGIGPAMRRARSTRRSPTRSPPPIWRCASTSAPRPLPTPACSTPSTSSCPTIAGSTPSGPRPPSAVPR